MDAGEGRSLKRPGASFPHLAVCHECRLSTTVRNCTRDEGGPFEVGNQVLISSHRNGIVPHRAGDAHHLCHSCTKIRYTRPTLNTYAAKRRDLLAIAKDLFDVVLSGTVRIEVYRTYTLRDAAQAHRELESRKTVGSTVLTV